MLSCENNKDLFICFCVDGSTSRYYHVYVSSKYCTTSHCQTSPTCLHQEHMTVMNQSSVSPLSVTVSVPRSCNDSVVLRDTNTRYS